MAFDQTAVVKLLCLTICSPQALVISASLHLYPEILHFPNIAVGFRTNVHPGENFKDGPTSSRESSRSLVRSLWRNPEQGSEFVLPCAALQYAILRRCEIRALTELIVFVQPREVCTHGGEDCLGDRAWASSKTSLFPLTSA